MSDSEVTINVPCASKVLIDEGTLTIDELRIMVSEDIDALKKLAFRYNGVQAELAQVAALIAQGAVQHDQDDDAVLDLAFLTFEVAKKTGAAVSQMRDLLEQLAEHDPDPLNDADRDEEE